MTVISENVTVRDAHDLPDLFDAGPGYLNAATLGLPGRSTMTALHRALSRWQAGQADMAQYDDYVTAARLSYAHLIGVQPADVATGSQVSVTAGLVAANLPAGARVVCAAGDFTSMVFPFLAQADRGVTVEHVPLAELPNAVERGCDLVAYSLVQSADGALADAAAIVAAAARTGAMTMCDTTQAMGWLDIDGKQHDITVCSAYKWLCSPRGTAFSSFSERARQSLRPNNAGWYAGRIIWDSCYGPQMELATDARKFDVSPAWLSWVGTAAALAMLSELPPGLARRHGSGLADDLRARLDLPPQGRPIVALPDPAGTLATALTSAGCVVAARAGGVRLGFHLWNTAADVELAAAALLRAR
jgi:selenocysteine lyase/cysteine desulfurase